MLARGIPLGYVKALCLTNDTTAIEWHLIDLMIATLMDKARQPGFLELLHQIYDKRGVAAPWDVEGVFANRFKDHVGAPQAMPTLSYVSIRRKMRMTTSHRVYPILQMQHLAMLLGGWLMTTDPAIRDSAVGMRVRAEAERFLQMLAQQPVTVAHAVSASA